jgi:hypothetical protein
MSAAFAQIPRKDHDLVIVGNRWYQGEAAERRAASLGLDGRVKFMGYVPRCELPSWFSGATAFVYPSLLEGFGLPIVEAMACGAPVITSNNSSMKEISDGAAMLVDPRNVRAIAESLSRVAEDAALRQELRKRGLERSTEFSWQRTAQLTLDIYREAAGRKPQVALPVPPAARQCPKLRVAIQKTIDYAKLFQYPLHGHEVRERLFDVAVDQTTLDATLESLQYRPAPDLLKLRAEREAISDQAVSEMAPHLRTLASMPFVRLIAFSGSTAHRNMTTTEDIDLFMVVEDGKLWAVFLAAMVWAKVKGLRKRLCMNYLISDAALPLFDHDAFTAQQAASLKPVYGKDVYDQFIKANPFISRNFPNFEPVRHREAFPEIEVSGAKRLMEAVLSVGPAQMMDRLSRSILSRYLTKKIRSDSDVQLDPRRLKLHLSSHKRTILHSAAFE